MKPRPGRLPYRLTTAYASLFSMITLVIFLIVYIVMVSAEENRMNLNYRLFIDQPLKQTERFLDEMDDIAYKAMTNRELILQYSILRDDRNPENYFASQVMVSIDATSVLTGINRGIAPVWRISAYNGLGDYIYSGATIDKEKTQARLAARNAGELMRSFAVGEAEFYLSGPGEDFWTSYYKSRYISLIRPIMNVYSRDVVGLVEVQSSLDTLERDIAGLSQADLHVNVYDANGDSVIAANVEGELVASAVSEQYGWRVELLDSGSVLSVAKRDILRLLLISWVLVSAAVLAIIVAISGYISRPLTALTKAVQGMNVTSPERLGDIQTGIGEVNALRGAFNQVIERLRLSAEQEKRAFLLAMQTQMNPHFIHNVLSVIGAAAMDGRGEQVVNICGNLSGMLRYSSSFGNASVTVEEELGHTRLYLELMKARYDYMFDYEISADPSLADTAIPKLSIQPICENAFTHAFSRMEPPYVLSLAVQKEREGWSITVTDNGPGVSPEKAKETVGKIKAADRAGLGRLSIGGMGLVSTVLRLKLLTGRDIELIMESGATCGAVVKLLIPYGESG